MEGTILYTIYTKNYRVLQKVVQLLHMCNIVGRVDSMTVSMQRVSLCGVHVFFSPI